MPNPGQTRTNPTHTRRHNDRQPPRDHSQRSQTNNPAEMAFCPFVSLFSQRTDLTSKRYDPPLALDPQLATTQTRRSSNLTQTKTIGDREAPEAKKETGSLGNRTLDLTDRTAEAILFFFFSFFC